MSNNDPWNNNYEYNDDYQDGVDPETQARLQFATTAGFLARFGPGPEETSTWPLWRRVLCRLTPRRHRWRWSELAPLVRDYLSR